MSFKSPAPRSGRLRPNPGFFSPSTNGKEDSVSGPILKQARKTGNLNLSNRGLTSVPRKVWRLNIDPPEGATPDFNSDEKWWDQVEMKRLNLSANEITELSEELENFPALQCLDVQYNKLSGIPAAIGTLRNLSELMLSHNQLSSLPDEIMNLSSLLVLRLDNNRLTQLPQTFVQLESLETLNLAHNVLSCLPPDIDRLRSLRSINVSENSLTSLPDSLGNMLELRELVLNDNKLSSIPTLRGLNQLGELNIRHNKLTELPDIVKTCLKSLLLGFNQVSVLSEDRLRNLKTLTILELRDNRIKKLPDCIVELEKLERLDLSNNDLSSLPFVMGRMEYLQSLHLEGNSLRTIRREIVNRGTTELLKYLRGRIEVDETPSPTDLESPLQLNKMRSYSRSEPIPTAGKNTKELNISKKELTAISEDDIRGHSHCSKLDASSNRLKRLPDSIGTIMIRLTVLELSNNHLTSLPSSLESCNALQDVIISGNRFTVLPEVLYCIPTIENILAGDNQIAAIDVDGLMKLKSLACLDLHNNDIHQIPPQLGRMEWLRNLVINGNPFRNPRPNIVAKGTAELLQYLRDRIPT